MATPAAHEQGAATPRSASRRSSRRSWFETPPVTKLDMSFEKPPLKTMSSRNKRRSVDEVETLVLSHFTKPPRVGFGKMLVGRTKSRVILVQNPSDYDQEVVVERFPYKKGFNIDQTRFTVGPEEVVSLTLTWSPQDAGGCREMILFYINEVYRLQAYVFGTVEDPKPVKKGRKGLMGARRLKSGQTNMVLETKSLKSICDNYSPRRSQEIRELRSQVRPAQQTRQGDQENVRPVELDYGPPETPPPLESTAICRSDERHDQKALERRVSSRISPTLAKMSPIPMTADNNNGRILESYFLSTTNREQTPVLSYARNGKGDSPVKGEKDEGLENRSPLRPLSGNSNTLSGSVCAQVSSGENGNNSNSSLHNSRQKLENTSAGSKKGRSSRQHSSSEVSQKMMPAKQSPPVPETDGHVHVSPNTFLNDSLAGRQGAMVPEFDSAALSSQVRKVMEQATVSPRSFLEDLGSAKLSAAAENASQSSVPSPSVILNNSIPHDIMLRQLQHVRRSLHETSLCGSPFAGTPTLPAVPSSKPAAKPPSLDRLKQLAQPKARGNVFSQAHSQQGSKKDRFLQRKLQEQARFAKITDVPSPRRATFLVSKKKLQQNAKRTSPQKSQPRAGDKARKAGSGKSAADVASVKGGFRFCTNDVLEGDAVDSAPVTQEAAASVDCNTTPPTTSAEAVGETDGMMTPRRRSQWASPAVKGFELPVMATRPECDSTGEASTLHTVENIPRDSLEDVESTVSLAVDDDDDKSAPTLSQLDDSEIELRRNSSRRLFPEVSVGAVSESPHVKAQWCGTATVTKDRNSVSPRHSSQSGSANGSRKLFADIHAGENSELISLNGSHGNAEILSSQKTTARSKSLDFASPHQLPTIPLETEAGRRATLTVTKARPSQALLDAGHKDKCALKETKEAATEMVEEEEGGDESEGDVWYTDTVVIETRNSAIVGVSMTRGVMTPSQLPTSPRPETSRRSTHVLRDPVVLDKDGLVPRNLFPASDAQAEGGHGGRLQRTWTEEEEEEIRPDHKPASEKQDQTLSSSQKTAVLDTSNQHNRQSQEIVGEKSTSEVEVNVFTERVEQRMECHRSKIVSAARIFCAAADVVLLDSSCSSQELSTDSLEPGVNVSSPGRQNGSCEVYKLLESEEETIVYPPADVGDELESQVDSKDTSASSSDSEISFKTADDGNGADVGRLSDFEKKDFEKKENDEVEEVEKRTNSSLAFAEFAYSSSSKSDRDLSCTETFGDLTGGSCVSGSGSSKATTEISTSRSEVFEVSDTILCTESASRTYNSDSSFPEVTPSPSDTHLTAYAEMSAPATVTSSSTVAAEVEKVDFFDCAPAEGVQSQTITKDQPSVLSPPAAAISSGSREAWVIPVNSDTVTKEKPQRKAPPMKENLVCAPQTAASETDIPAKSGSVSSKRFPRSLSSEFRARAASQPQEVVKHAGTEKPTNGRSLKQKGRVLSASSVLGKGTGTCKLQSGSEQVKQQDDVEQAARLTKKRTSPQAGLKDPKSKRVELEANAVPRRILQPQSQNKPALSTAVAGRVKSENARKPAKGVALSKLILVKKSKTALPKHPLPFASKNMYYDERWQDKQERGFVHWLNFVLTPADEYNSAVNKTKVDARTITFDKQSAPRLAPTKEVLSFRAYTARRRLNHLRRASCRLFQSEAVVKVVCRLEHEVEQRRLAVRTDRMVHADIGLKQKILDMLLSYNPLWLRIGLEAVTSLDRKHDYFPCRHDLQRLKRHPEWIGVDNLF